MRAWMFHNWSGLTLEDHSQDERCYKHTPHCECDGRPKYLVEANFRIRIRAPWERQGMNEAAQPVNHRQAHDVAQGQSYGYGPPDPRVDQKSKQNARTN